MSIRKYSITGITLQQYITKKRKFFAVELAFTVNKVYIIELFD